MANNYCFNCGNEIREDFNVCPYCGKKLVVSQNKQFCHLCGTLLNDEGNCPKCIEESNIIIVEEPKKFNICSLLSFILAIVSFYILMLGFTNNIIDGVFIVLSISSFVLQFFGRKNTTAKVWKVFSWISFGMGILLLIIALFIIFGDTIYDIPDGSITDF